MFGSFPDGEMGGLMVNVMLVFIALSVSIVTGTILGNGRLSRNIFIRYPIGWFIDLLRSTPLVMILFWIYFFLPAFNISVSVFPSAAIALCLYGSAVQAEIIRAGILAVPKGQMEAAVTIGLTKFQAMRYIILPQAFRIMVPSFVSFMVSLFKDTSIAYIIGVVELLRTAVIVSQRLPNRIFAAYLCVAIGFWIISFGISRVADRLEKKTGRLDVGLIKLKGQRLPEGLPDKKGTSASGTLSGS